MTKRRHFISLLGAVGTLLGAASVVGVWYVELRLDRAREKVFDRVDESFSGINRRLIETEGAATKLKISVEDIQQRMQEWTKNEAVERLDARFDVEGKAQQLTAGLRQADMMLELSRETVENIRQALEVGTELGLAVNADSVKPLLERITEIKEDLRQAVDAAERLLARIHDGDDSESPAARAEQAATIAARLLATFGNLESRLATFRDRVSEAQDAIGRANTKTHARLLAAAFCATLFLLWMTAGQVCLFRWARNGSRRGAVAN